MSGVFYTTITNEIMFINQSTIENSATNHPPFIVKVAGGSTAHGNQDGSFESNEVGFENIGTMKYDASTNTLYVTVSAEQRLVRILDFATRYVYTVSNSAGDRFVFTKSDGLSTGGRFPGMDVDKAGSYLYVTDRTKLFNLTRDTSSTSISAYVRNEYTALTAFKTANSWPNNVYIFGVAAVESHGMIYVTVSLGLNLLLRIPMGVSHYSEITVLAGDPSVTYGGIGSDDPTPYLQDGFGTSALLAFPSSITYDPVGDSLYFTESFSELGSEFDDFNVGSMTVRKYSVYSGYVSTYAGYDFSQDRNGSDVYTTAGGYRDGWGDVAEFSYPLTISYAYSHLNRPVLFVTDFLNDAIRVLYSSPFVGQSVSSVNVVSYPNTHVNVHSFFSSDVDSDLLIRSSTKAQISSTSSISIFDPNISAQFYQLLNSCSFDDTFLPTYFPTSKPTVRASATPTITYDIELAESIVDEIINGPSCDYRYKDSVWYGDQRSGGASMWRSFLANATVDYNFKIPRSVSVVVAGANCSGCSRANSYSRHIVCDDEQSLTSFYTALSEEVDGVVECSGHSWKTEMCSDSTLRVCVDCETPCDCGSNLAFPTDVACYGVGGRSSGMCMDIESLTTPPTFSHISTAPNFNTRSIVVTLHNISAEGYLYCAAYDGLPVITSVESIMVSGVRGYASGPGSFEVELTKLAIGVNYTILCYTESVLKQESGAEKTALSTVYDMAVKSTILGLKAIYLSYSGYRIPTAQSSSKFSIILNDRPSKAVEIGVQTYFAPLPQSGQCSLLISPDSLTVSTASVIPSQILFTSTSSIDASKAFRIYPLDAGCYYVTLNVSGDSAEEYYVNVSSSYSADEYVVIQAYGTDVTPEPPTLLAAKFSNSGASLAITFDSRTDMGMNGGLFDTVFSCDRIFSFAGASDSSCTFLSDREIKAALPALLSPVPSVGSSLSLLPGVVTAACTAGSTTCPSYGASPAAEVEIEAPLDPIIPTVRITAPQWISACSSLQLSYEQSSGSGGRNWTEAVWSAESLTQGADAKVTAYLNSAFSTCSEKSRCRQIPSSYLTSGRTYKFKLMLKNFLGASDSSSVTVVKRLKTTVPHVLFDGSRRRNIFTYETFAIHARASPSTCSGTSTTSSTLSYKWTVSSAGKTITSVINTASSPLNFIAAPYSFASGSDYKITLVVTDVVAGTSASSSMRVYVLDGSIVPLIRGGNYVTKSAGEVIELDASFSYDESVGTQRGEESNLSYSWDCIKVSPALDECGLDGVSSTKSVITIPANTLDSSATYEFTVLISNVISKAETTVELVTTAADKTTPVLEVSVLESDEQSGNRVVNWNDDIILSSTVISSSDAIAVWSILSSDTTLSELNFTVTSGGTFSFPHRVPRTFLANGDVSYIFQLAVYPNHCTDCAAAVTSVIVQVNAGPLYGDFDVFPIEGVAGTSGTNFSMASILCEDDDLPLSYSFAYLNAGTDSTLITAFSEFSFVSSYLPAGSLRDGKFYLTLKGTVFDRFGASTSRTTDVIVAPRDYASVDTLNDKIVSEIEYATGIRDYNLLFQSAASAHIAVEHYISLNGDNDKANIADIIFSLIDIVTSHLNEIEFTENSLYIESAISLCSLFANGTVVQTGEFPAVIEAAIVYSSEVSNIFIQSEFQSVDTALSLLSCVNTLDSAAAKAGASGQRRKLDLSNMYSVPDLVDLITENIIDILLVGEEASGVYSEFSVYVAIGWPFTLSNSIAGFPLSNEKPIPPSNFSEVLNFFDLNIAAKYILQVSTFSDIVEPDCEVENATCTVISAAGRTISSIMLSTTENVSVSEEASVWTTMPHSRNVSSDVTHLNEVHQVELYCEKEPSFSTQEYFCSADVTNGLSTVVEVECLANSLGTWTVSCPLYNTLPICADGTGAEDSSCNVVKFDGVSTTCSCPVSFNAFHTSDRRHRRLQSVSGEKEYAFSTESSVLLGTVLEFEKNATYESDRNESPTPAPVPVPVIKSSADDAVVETRTLIYSIAFPILFLCCLLCIGLYFLKRSYDRQQLEEKYANHDSVPTGQAHHLLLLRAKELRDDGNLEDAEETFRKALNLQSVEDDEFNLDVVDPMEKVEVINGLAEVLSAQGKYLDAIPLYQQAHQQFHHTWESAHSLVGGTKTDVHDLDDWYGKDIIENSSDSDMDGVSGAEFLTEASGSSKGLEEMSSAKNATDSSGNNTSLGAKDDDADTKRGRSVQFAAVPTVHGDDDNDTSDIEKGQDDSSESSSTVDSTELEETIKYLGREVSMRGLDRSPGEPHTLSVGSVNIEWKSDPSPSAGVLFEDNSHNDDINHTFSSLL